LTAEALAPDDLSSAVEHPLAGGAGAAQIHLARSVDRMGSVRIVELNGEGKVEAIDQADVVVVCPARRTGKGELGETCVARSGVLALETAAVACLAGALSIGVKGALTTTPETATDPGSRQ
jgi:hypothetical protein